jgi:hypothetical protein
MRGESAARIFLGSDATMRKSPILLCCFLLASVGAAVPKEKTQLGYDLEVGATGGPYEAAAAAPAPHNVSGYPPCRPGRGDDRCIQLYEGRVRAALPRAAVRRAERPAMGGPIEGEASYPHCSRLITDECVQLFDRAPRPARPARATTRRPAPPSEASTPGI